MQSRNNTSMPYIENWVYYISDKRLWSYQGDKVTIWQKKIKDGRHDPDILPAFLKNWCSLAIN